MEKHLEALKDAAVRPLWHDPDIMPGPLAPITSEEKCELLIVGGGFTGLWAAMQAKERKPDADIVVVAFCLRPWLIARPTLSIGSPMKPSVWRSWVPKI
jgi:hypothetical protein